MKLDDDIHNYYEHLVLEKIDTLGLNKSKSEDYIADLSCLALNQIPPRYIRHEVDMSFYLPQSEKQQMEMNVLHAIEKALKFLDQNDKKYYIIKNSWGETGPYKGLIYMSQAYFRLKTVAVMLHKNAVKKDIAKKVKRWR